MNFESFQDNAENAESQAQQQITEAEAQSQQRSEVARARAEAAILRKRNELGKVQAELDGAAESVEREAKAAAATARAEAEQALQRLRLQLEQKRLEADVIIPAETERRAMEIVAQGKAAPTLHGGRAVLQVLAAMTEAFEALGPHAKEVFVIQHLEEIVKAVQEGVRVQVDQVHLLDPGDGSALSNYAASYPQVVAAMLQSIGQTTGIDIPLLLRNRTTATSTTAEVDP